MHRVIKFSLEQYKKYVELINIKEYSRKKGTV